MCGIPNRANLSILKQGDQTCEVPISVSIFLSCLISSSLRQQSPMKQPVMSTLSLKGIRGLLQPEGSALEIQQQNKKECGPC